jgi:hypothetical protein
MFHLSSEQQPPPNALKDTLVTIKGMLDGVKVVQGELNQSITGMTGEMMKLRELSEQLDVRVKSCEESLSDELTEPETETESEPPRNHVDVLHKEPSEFMKSIITFLIVVLLISSISGFITNKAMLRLT